MNTTELVVKIGTENNSGFELRGHERSWVRVGEVMGANPVRA